MSQDEIIDWLREQRLHGSCEFFSIPSIKDGVSASGLSGAWRIHEQCLQLYRFGILEIRRDGLRIIGYRLRKKYVIVGEDS